MENEALVLDLLEWISVAPRSYTDTMNAWRTSCPRLTIWEDALTAGYLAVRNREVHLTAGGRKFLSEHRNQIPAVPHQSGQTPKVLLIGGTSHVGKSTLAKQLARRPGWNHLSTDRLARHPGRPWRIGKTDVPKDVIEHYLGHSTPELTDSVLTHFRRNVWPIADAIVRSHVNNPFDPCLVFEGSAILPELVMASRFKNATAVWLTASERLITDRIVASSHYEQRTRLEKQLIDAFLMRSLAFNQLILAQVHRCDLLHLDVDSPDTIENLTAEMKTSQRRSNLISPDNFLQSSAEFCNSGGGAMEEAGAESPRTI